MIKYELCGKILMVITMNGCICKNIIRLETPVGNYCISDGKNNIPFSVYENSYKVPYYIYEDGEIADELSTETNYAIVIDLKNLQIGKEYRIVFSESGLKYGGSDEHTESRVMTIDGWCVGIGAYDPNDVEKIVQDVEYSKKTGAYESGFIQAPPEYDESKFKSYFLTAAEDGSGFTFKLLDESVDRIVFKVAWIQGGFYEKEIYESAIDFWLT